MNEKCSALF